MIEDSEDSRMLIKFILEKAGAKVTDVESATLAREELKKCQPDLILSDIGLPEESGIEFIEKIRTSEFKNIPAIALTAYVRSEEKDAALQAGFQAHVGKPIHTETLLSEIKKLTTRADCP